MVLVDRNGFTINEVEGDFTAAQWATRFFSEYIVCPSEDVNGNRFLDTIGPVSEDINGNGSLDPQDPASLTAVEDESYATLSGGSLTTDSNGSGFFELLYPASNSAWAFVEITARAEALGSEAEDAFRTVLPLPGSEINATDELPANYISPYGDATLPDDATLHSQVTINGETMPVYSGCTFTY